VGVDFSPKSVDRWLPAKPLSSVPPGPSVWDPANSRDSTDQNFPCAAAARANSWTSIAESWFCNEDVRTTMQLYAQSDQESKLEAQGKFLALLLGDKAHLLMETIQ